MSGTRAGGLKVRDRVLANDPGFYARIGRIGGATKSSKPKGFAWMAIHEPEKVRRAGIKGGAISRRRPRAT